MHLFVQQSLWIQSEVSKPSRYCLPRHHLVLYQAVVYKSQFSPAPFSALFAGQEQHLDEHSSQNLSLKLEEYPMDPFQDLGGQASLQSGGTGDSDHRGIDDQNIDILVLSFLQLIEKLEELLFGESQKKFRAVLIDDFVVFQLQIGTQEGSHSEKKIQVLVVSVFEEAKRTEYGKRVLELDEITREFVVFDCEVVKVANPVELLLNRWVFATDQLQNFFGFLKVGNPKVIFL
jgi:hypothetical protein